MEREAEEYTMVVNDDAVDKLARKLSKVDESLSPLCLEGAATLAIAKGLRLDLSMW